MSQLNRGLEWPAVICFRASYTENGVESPSEQSGIDRNLISYSKPSTSVAFLSINSRTLFIVWPALYHLNCTVCLCEQFRCRCAPQTWKCILNAGVWCRMHEVDLASVSDNLNRWVHEGGSQTFTQETARVLNLTSLKSGSFLKASSITVVTSSLFLPWEVKQSWTSPVMLIPLACSNTHLPLLPSSGWSCWNRCVHMCHIVSFSHTDQLRNSYHVGNDHSLRVIYANGMDTHYQTEPHILAGTHTTNQLSPRWFWLSVTAAENVIAAC